MTRGSADVVVIGAGAIGLAAAYYLAQAGVAVTVVDRRGVGQEASGANVGLVTLFSPHSLDEPEPGPSYALTLASADAYLTLGEETGVDLEYERCGGVFLAVTEERLRLIRAACEGYRRHGLPVEWLDPAGVRACEPALHCDGILGGGFFPLNGQLNPLRLCRALAEGCRRHGVRLMLGTTVEGITCAGGHVRSVRTSAGELACGHVVNAAGAWAADVARMVGVRVPVVPGRGQLVLTEPVARFARCVVLGVSPTARQTRRGNALIGSTLDHAGFDKTTTVDTITELARGVVRHYPAVRGLRVLRTWAGLRPMTPDHRPIIEMLDEPAGFCLATGHSHRGICLGAGTGQVVADLVTGTPPRVALDGFRLGRFADAAATGAHR